MSKTSGMGKILPMLHDLSHWVGGSNCARQEQWGIEEWGGGVDVTLIIGLDYLHQNRKFLTPWMVTVQTEAHMLISQEHFAKVLI